MNTFNAPPFIIGALRLGSWGNNLAPAQLESFIAGCMDLGLHSFDHADIYGDYRTEFEFGPCKNVHCVSLIDSKSGGMAYALGGSTRG